MSTATIQLMDHSQSILGSEENDHFMLATYFLNRPVVLLYWSVRKIYPKCSSFSFLNRYSC